MERAARLLTEGPLEPVELALHVMGLTGPSAQAASIVRTLLGDDGRFREDARGRWGLVDPGVLPGPPLQDLHFAVVDVETTGGAYHRGHRMTEVAVVSIEGGVVRESFRTLVNPGRRIPDRVRALTGITDAMVSGAPYFDQVAADLAGRLCGRVFVAHNARFDWRFLREQLAEATGDVPEPVASLCTVRLCRTLLPDLRRYRLDAVAAHFDIPIVGRHRAWGDALATARILLRLLDEASLQGITDLERLVAAMGPARRRERSGLSPSSSPVGNG